MLCAPAVVAALGMLAMAACDDGSATGTTTSVAAAPTTTVARPNDGVLRIGVLLPNSGSAAAFGRPLIAAAELAVREINAAGGVLGNEVELEFRDEGATTPLALQAARELIDLDVDAIVGPASSNVALGVLEHIVSAGVVACSPTASSLALDAFPDDNLFFRTIPSDSLLAAALADQIEQTGQPSVAIAFIDDPYGRPLAAALEAEAHARNLTVVASVGYDASDDDRSDVAAELLSAEPAVVAVIGDRDHGMDVVAATGEASRDVMFVVNDAMRAPLSQQVRQRMRAATLDDIVGVAPPARTNSEAFAAAMGDANGPYAVNAYDCVNLLALASAQTLSDAPHDIAEAMSAASSGGSACATFAHCAALLAEGRNVDYNGPDGQVELTPLGEAFRARFDVFSFDSNGVDRLDGSIAVSRGD